MNNQIFRKKSMDRISSPEQLNDYLRVSTPGTWMILAAVLVLLAGACIWGFFGHMDSKLPVCVSSDETAALCYVPEEYGDAIEAGMRLIIDEEEYRLGEVPVQPTAVDENVDAYILHIGGFQMGDWVYAAPVQGGVPQGIHEAELVLESISPMSFILN